MVRTAKKRKQSITAGVCPHHLYLTDKDCERMGSTAMMKPPLGTQKDQDELWAGLQDGTIDVIETDHAPHTLEEKKKAPPPFGVPGLETALSLTLKAVNDKKLKLGDVVKLLHENPKKIFKIPDQKNTYVEVDIDKQVIVGENGYVSKCNWSPFAGWELPGIVEKVVLRGRRLI